MVVGPPQVEYLVVSALKLPAVVGDVRRQIRQLPVALAHHAVFVIPELGRGKLDQVYIKGQTGYVILMSIASEAVLTVLARDQAKLGLLFLDMRRAAEDLEKLL